MLCINPCIHAESKIIRPSVHPLSFLPIIVSFSFNTCFSLYRRRRLQHLHHRHGLPRVGIINALCGKAEIESIFVGADAISHAWAQSERHQFPQVKSRHTIRYRLKLNLINFCREKLPQYDIDTSFMFPIVQDNCQPIVKNQTNFE